MPPLVHVCKVIRYGKSNVKIFKLTSRSKSFCVSLNPKTSRHKQLCFQETPSINTIAPTLAEIFVFGGTDNPEPRTKSPCSCVAHQKDLRTSQMCVGGRVVTCQKRRSQSVCHFFQLSSHSSRFQKDD